MSLTHYLLDIIFPPICFSCKEYLKDDAQKSRHICDVCFNKLDYMPGFLCPVCMKRLSAPENVCHENSQFMLAAPLKYSNPATREIIRVLKYGGVKAAADPIVSILIEYLSASILNSKFEILNYVIIPVPISFSRKRERGFNQALVIAEKLGEKLNIPVISNALEKIKATPSQTKKKSNKEREENVRGSFAVKKPELILNKNILVVDDVFTSGATMREAARVLKLAGANKIIALAIARA